MHDLCKTKMDKSGYKDIKLLRRQIKGLKAAAKG